MGRLALTMKMRQGLSLYTSDGEIHLEFVRIMPNGGIRFTVEAPKEVQVVRDDAKEREPPPSA